MRSVLLKKALSISFQKEKFRSKQRPINRFIIANLFLINQETKYHLEPYFLVNWPLLSEIWIQIHLQMNFHI
jgi:hypothetical protein